MNLTIDSSNAVENDAHEFVAEASALRLRPGQWPREIPTTIGNGRAFRFERFSWQGAEVVCAIYRQDEGCVSLKIFND